MRKIIITALTAGLLAIVGVTNAQETDTTTYSSNTYSQDTSSYDDTYREQQGADTFNDTRNETEYSNTESAQTDGQTNDYRGTNTGEGSNDPQRNTDPNSGVAIPGANPAQDTTGNYDNSSRHDDPAGSYIAPRSGSTDEGSMNEGTDPANTSSEYYDRQERATPMNEADSLEVGNEKDDSAEFPDTPSSERGLNQEAGTAPIEGQPSIHNQGDQVRQEGLNKNKDYQHTGDQSYNDEQPRNTGIGSDDAIGPRQEEAHRQAREELTTATDTLDYASQRNADPEKVGNRVESMADSVSQNIRDKDKAKHGLED